MVNSPKKKQKNYLSQQDNAWKAPESVGTFVSKREHQLIEDLLNNVKSGEVNADAESVQMLEDFVAQGPDNRFKHIVGGGAIRQSAMRKAAMAAAVPGSALGAFSGFMGWGMHAGLAWGVAGGACGGWRLGWRFRIRWRCCWLRSRCSSRRFRRLRFCI